MPKSVILPIVSVVGLGVLFLVLWLLSYALPSEAPARVSITGLRSQVEVGWVDDVHSIARVSSVEQDGYFALGFVHGIANTWTALLLRQAATGTLGTWFEADMSDLDRVSKTLDISGVAQDAYERASVQIRSRHNAYAAGMNAALATNKVERDESLLLFDIDQGEWEPWHTFAVEMLLAWASASQQIDDPLVATSQELKVFAHQSRDLFSWLRLGGFNSSLAWVYEDPDSGGREFYHRMVLGSSAFSRLHFLSFVDANSVETTLATIPGTVVFPFGHSGSQTFARMMRSGVSMGNVEADSIAVDEKFRRVFFKDGSEELVRSSQSGNSLVFDCGGDSLQKTCTLLNWVGLIPDRLGSSRMSDRIPVGDRQDVWIDDALMQSGNRVETTGSPIASGSGLWLVGDSTWNLGLTSLLRREDASISDRWTKDSYSVWAAVLTPVVLLAAESRSFESDVMNEAIEYLRNWDYRFEPSSIAASIFDRWAATHEREMGAIPTFTAVPKLDSLAQSADLIGPLGSRAQIIQFLVLAVNELATEFGSDIRLWRWENVRRLERLYPIWSDPRSPRIASRAVLRRRYSPVQLAPGGHPSALRWGPTSTNDGNFETEVYEVIVGHGQAPKLYSRTDGNRPSDALRLLSANSPFERETLLNPAR